MRELEERVNRDLLEALMGWLAAKPLALGKSEAQRISLILSIFGGWIFYLFKRGSQAVAPGLTDELMLDLEPLQGFAEFGAFDGKLRK